MCESVFVLEIVNMCVTYSHTWACYYVTPYMRKLPANVWHNTHQVLPNSYTQHNCSCCMVLLLKHFFFKPLLNPQRMNAGPGGAYRNDANKLYVHNNDSLNLCI